MELSEYPNSNLAKNLLNKLLKETKNIVNKRKWIFFLEEFLPKESELLGINQKYGNIITIKVRLRSNDLQFLEYSNILGTFIHELTHMEIRDHGPNFIKLEDILNNEYENENNEFLKRFRQNNNITDEFCFSTKGNRLGGKLTNKSRLLDEPRIINSVNKLGGNNIKNVNPNIMVANATLLRYQNIYL